MGFQRLWTMGDQSIRSLEDENGILASARNEMFGCVFGRDSLITSLKLLKVYERTSDPYYLNLVRKILVSLAKLQGTRVNIETGEEPGKCIHEYRPTDHEHLTGPDNEQPWHVCDDGAMRIYDTVDATPLMLILIWRYIKVSGDNSFLFSHSKNISAALEWLLTYADSNNDGLIDYSFPDHRKAGGLRTQSWMDSVESIFFEESFDTPRYPIAPVEAQAYAYMALRVWSEFLPQGDGAFAQVLRQRAELLKQEFNRVFVLRDGGKTSLAFAIDGRGRPMTSVRSSMGHVLWAAVPGETPECVLDAKHIPSLAHRLMRRDMFVPRAGLRTLSSRSRMFKPSSYHNGSIWPHDTAMVAEGLDNFGFGDFASDLRRALVHAYRTFDTPLELFISTGGKLGHYRDANGGGACRVQAWSAASILTTLVGMARG